MNTPEGFTGTPGEVTTESAENGSGFRNGEDRKAHTPGPWTLETVETQVGCCHKIGPFPSDRTRPTSYACVYVDGLPPDRSDATPVGAELLANARLMASAPDLLAELVKCRAKLVTALQDTPQDLADPTRDRVIRRQIEEASAAIAKARP